MDLRPIVVINKVDKPNCRPDEVHEAVFDLMFNLEATEEQLNFPTVYGSSKQGWMSDDWKKPTNNIHDLLDTIINYIPEYKVEPGTLQMKISSLDYSSYMGRIAVGKVSRGTIKAGQQVSVVKKDGTILKSTIKGIVPF